MNSWIECTDYNKLPLGSWIVKIDDKDEPYQIAYVYPNKLGDERSIFVGNLFPHDVGDLIAYREYGLFEDSL